MLPNDINMLVSFLNTKLRDDDMSLEHLLEVNDADRDEVMMRLEANSFYFDEASNQIKAKQSKSLGFAFLKLDLAIVKKYILYQLEMELTIILFFDKKCYNVI